MNLQDPMIAFIEAAATKYMKGVKEHRDGNEETEFVGCLFHEYEDEQLDSYNYIRKMFVDGKISETEFLRATQIHMECWFWMRVNVNKENACACGFADAG